MSEKAANNRLEKNPHEKYLVVLCWLLSFVFLISLFKNISYPLFWADESMTVMGGVRVLDFGYPKVHDGKNVLYDLLHPNVRLGIDEKTDAYIGGANWGQYYFAAPGIKLAEMSDDLFTKTAVIRVTFALVGLAGLAILAFLGRQFFHTKLSGTGFLALFALFEVISIPVVLHLREARYYPLAIFLVALTIFAYAQYRILKNIRYSTYTVFLIVFLFLVFVTFSPAYFIFFASFSVFETLLLAKHLLFKYRGERVGSGAAAFKLREIFKDYLLALLPVIISLIVISPLIYFFRTFYISNELTNYNVLLFNKSRLNLYLENLSTIWRYFASTDFIYLAIFMKICLLVCFFIKLAGKSLASFDMPKVVFSNLLTILFIVYSIAICKIPNFLFTRYFISLQPILAIIIILDLAVVLNFFRQYQSSIMIYGRVLLVVIFAGFVFYNISRNADNLTGHVYELSHQYRGPLDYVIPFIKEKYANTDALVIATNYEETSFMYYLNAKVTVGFVGNNLEQDSQIIPDIIVYRKWHRIFMPTFLNFLEKQPYVLISFPIADYPVNNIPELNWLPPVQHQFRTMPSENALGNVEIYVR